LIDKLVELGHVEDDLRKKITVSDGNIIGLDFAELAVALGTTEEAILQAKEVAERTANSATIAFREASEALTGFSAWNPLKNQSNIYAATVGNKIRNTEDFRDFRFEASETFPYIDPHSGVVSNVKRDESQVSFEKDWNRLMDEGNLGGILSLL
jgi:hypothetical protein